MSVDDQEPLKDVEVLKSEVRDILIERLSFSLEHQFKTSSGRDLLEKLSRLEITPRQAADLLSGL
jgi:flagellar basal body-associated protein FliL